MDNTPLVSVVEIPVLDFSRAINFYQNLMNIKIDEFDMDGTQMGVLGTEEATVNVVLVKSQDYKPSADGTLVYLSAGKDLQPLLDRVEPNGGQLILGKTEISPEMGFFALFLDTEGNKMGLHSLQ